VALGALEILLAVGLRTGPSRRANWSPYHVCLSWSRSYVTTLSQSSSTLVGLGPDIISCRNVAVWNFRSCFCGAPSLTRGQVCNLRCNHSMVRVAQNPKPARVRVAFRPTVSWPVRLGIKPILGLLTRNLFSSEVEFWKLWSCLFWGALSDERSGLSFVSLVLVCVVLYILFTFFFFAFLFNTSGV
jgi:hypothetical protein